MMMSSLRRPKQRYREDHTARRDRLGRYTSFACGWIYRGCRQTTAPGCSLTWTWNHRVEPAAEGALQFPSRPTKGILSHNITFSHNGDAWMAGGENLMASHPDGRTLVVWLQHPLRGRYWRIHPMTWQILPSMKLKINLIRR